MRLSDLRQLRSFVVLAEDLNFHRTARKLHCSQPALTRLIKNLELQIGCSLLYRTTRKVELTSAGQAFLPEARRAILHADKALTFAREAGKGLHGYLSIGYTTFAMSGGLPEILVAFRKKHPGIHVTLHGLPTHQQAEALAENRISIGFGLPSLVQDGNASVVCHREPLFVYVAEDHPFASLDEVRIADLRDQFFVLGSWSLWQPYREFLDDICIQHGRFAPRVVQEATESHIILALVAARLGITVIPGNNTLGVPGLAVRPFREKNIVLETVAVWRRENRTETLKSFLGAVKRSAGQSLQSPHPSTKSR